MVFLMQISLHSNTCVQMEIVFCRYEFQMQYGSIGWSVGATLGYAQGAPEKRVIACIGDGSFQVSACPVGHLNVKQWPRVYVGR